MYPLTCENPPGRRPLRGIRVLLICYLSRSARGRQVVPNLTLSACHGSVLCGELHAAGHAFVARADTHKVPAGNSHKVLVLLDRVQDTVAVEEDATS